MGNDCEECGRDWIDDGAVDDLEQDLTNAVNMNAVQQDKLESAAKVEAELRKALQTVEAENHALRARLTAVALVIRP